MFSARHFLRLLIARRFDAFCFHFLLADYDIRLLPRASMYALSMITDFRCCAALMLFRCADAPMLMLPA